MVLIFALVVGSAIGAWNTWQRFGRSSRARTWSRNSTPNSSRYVLVLWPLFAIACVLGGIVGLIPASLVRTASGLSLMIVLLGFLAYFLLPLPVPRFVQPKWYRQQQRRGMSWHSD